MVAARSYRDHVAQTDRNRALAVVVVTPGDHGTVRQERQVVSATGGDGDDVGQAVRHVELTLGVVTPDSDGAVGQQSEAVKRAGRDGRSSVRPGARSLP